LKQACPNRDFLVNPWLGKEFAMGIAKTMYCELLTASPSRLYRALLLKTWKTGGF
jgi:hypothetical protein